MKKTLLMMALWLVVSSVRADIIRQTTDSDFYGGSLNAMAVTGSGAGAYLNLESSKFGMAGNEFVIIGTNDYFLHNPGDRLSMAFSVPKYMTVTAAVVFGQWLGTTAVYDVGLLADAYGGTTPVITQWLYPGSHNQVGSVLPTGNSYYMRVTFSADAYLNPSTPYHLFYGGITGLDGSNYFKPRSTTPNNKKYATDGSVDAYQTVLQSVDSGANWSENTGNQPVFILEYMDQLGAYTDVNGRAVSYIGNPYSTFDDTGVYGQYFVGQDFVIKNPVTITKIRAYVQYSGGTPADDLHVVVQDVTDTMNILLLTEEVFLLKTAAPSFFSWVEYKLVNQVNFLANHTYRIFFKSSGSALSADYLLKGGTIYQNPSQDTVFSADALASASYGGKNSYMVYTTGAGTSWDNFSFMRDLLIVLPETESVLFKYSGTYWSPVFDTKGQSTFNSISWSPADQPAGAGTQPVKFQAAANNDNSTWNYIGPDGTSATWFTDPAGSVLPGEFGNKRYFRFKLSMTTLDNTVSPSVDWIDINYTARPAGSDGISLTNYPNPFRPGNETTVIRYTMLQDSDVTITIMTPFAETVKKIKIASGSEGGKGAAGGYENTVAWDGKNSEGMTVETGIYICMVEVKSQSKTYKRKIAVLR